MMKRTFAIMVRVDHQIKQATEKAARADHRSVASLVQKLISEYLIGSGYLGENNAINPNNFRNELDTTSISSDRNNNHPDPVEENLVEHPTQTLTAQERDGSGSVAAVDADNEVSNDTRTSAKSNEDDTPPEIETTDAGKLVHLIKRVIREELD